MVLVSIDIALLVLASVINWTDSTSILAERNNLYTQSSAAAEAMTECIMANMASDFYAQNLQSTNSYTGTNMLPSISGWPVQFSFGNPYNNSAGSYVSINPINWTTNWTVLFGSNAAGLHAYVANCTAASTATTTNQVCSVSAGVQSQFVLAAIPTFQYAIFYNLNMEICPGAPMNITGPVFCNGSAWLGTTNVGFSGTVGAVGSISTNNLDPFCSNYTNSPTTGWNTNWSTNATSVALPIGTTNDPAALRALLGIPTNNSSPYSSTGQMYFINESDIIISNSSSGKISAFFQNTNVGLTSINYDVGTNGYSFATNVSFYDYRESKTVSAVQLNVGALKNWINGTNGASYNTVLQADVGHPIQSVYVYNNAHASSTNLPSVQITNGAVLPTNGLTVITPDPLYVLGNYNASGTSLNNGTNVTGTAPAALFADAITILSPNWNNQGYSNSTALSSRTATNTTINAAAYEGIVPSSGTNYSGGVENFLRLLEDWGPTNTLTYNGSIVVMFQSQYATNRWQPTSIYYNAPHRAWGYDLKFQTQNGLPPLTPELRTVYRQSWTSL